ncbi:hypothetical protein [Alicycliphilus denitrificans]|uniref:hypothetical protein n=1 Tax=Alicycliphilus denitrificans TaxID=179636 RepID=UPI00384FB3A9
MNNIVAFQRAMDALQQLAAPTPPWHDILATARDFIGADAGSFLMFGPDQDLWMLEQTGIDTAAEREYRDHFHALDPLVKPALDAPPGTWFDSLQLPPPPSPHPTSHTTRARALPSTRTTLANTASARCWHSSSQTMGSRKPASAFKEARRNPGHARAWRSRR